MTDDGVSKLEELKDLVQIDLNLTSVTEKSCQLLGRLPSLRKVDLSACQITDEGLKQLLDPRYTGETKHHCSFEELVLRFNESLTPNGVLRVAEVATKLKLLDVGNCGLNKVNSRTAFRILQRRNVRIHFDSWRESLLRNVVPI